MELVERIVARYLEARNHKPKVPAINKKKDRVVYVLPETLKEDSATYEKFPADKEDHVKNKGKPQRPQRPRKPQKPRKPEIPRATVPAPVRPPHRSMPIVPVPPVPKVKRVPPAKDPMPSDKRKWNVRKTRPGDVTARVVERFLEEYVPLSGSSERPRGVLLR